MDPETAVWLRTMGSVGLGALLGLLIEPLKLQIKARFDVKRLRPGLYRNVVEAEIHLRSWLGGDKSVQARQSLINIPTEHFNYVYDKHRETLFQMRELNFFLRFFQQVKTVVELTRPSGPDAASEVIDNHVAIALDTIGRFRSGPTIQQKLYRAADSDVRLRG